MADTETMDVYWERMSRPWIAHGAAMEAALAPVGAALRAKLSPQPGEAILDIGPGGGAALLPLAEAVGPTGRIVAVDIAPPMVARAKERLADYSQVEIRLADAGAEPIEAGGFDALSSQFGMMFFADPAAAFARLGSNFRPGARAVFAAWGLRQENPYFTIAGRVAAARLGPEETRPDPDAPGPFGLQNAERTLRLLTEAGFTNADPGTTDLFLAPIGTIEDFAHVMTEIGPAAHRLTALGADGSERQAMANALAAAYREFETENGILIPARVHIYSATWPG
ncbi:MAG: methyltransferase domain-containing protein [Pseudomonadota bacterium]